MLNNYIYKIQNYFIYFFIFSIFLIEKITYKSFSLYEATFVILTLVSINRLGKFRINQVLNNTNIFLAFFILLIMLKYLFFQNYLYQISVMVFLIINYFFFVILIINEGQKKITYDILKNSFKLIYIFSSIFILTLFLLKTFGLMFEEFWYLRDDVFPYLNKVTIHFKGLYTSYNYQAYIMIPGYFYILEKFSSKNTKIKLIFYLLLSFLIFYIVKSKVLFLLIIFTFFYIFNNLFTKKKYFFYSYIMLAFLTYVIISHFIPLKFEIIGDQYKHYFTEKPLIVFENFYIYGSLFFKIKSSIIENINYLNIFPSDRDFFLDNGIEPHSVYFLLFYNYGLTTLILFLLFIISIFKQFNFLFFKKNMKFLLIDYLIILIFLIEGFNQDINSYRLFWVSIAMFVGHIYICTRPR